MSFLNGYSVEEYHFFDDKKEYRRFSTIENSDPHIVKSYESGTTWKLWYIMIGTRSEGMHGELFDVNKKSVIGKNDGEIIVVEGSRYAWKGLFENRKNLFDQSGWIPENAKKYYPSQKLLDSIIK
jgi:hypothetical protein